jgi:hypothetical protein
MFRTATIELLCTSVFNFFTALLRDWVISERITIRIIRPGHVVRVCHYHAPTMHVRIGNLAIAATILLKRTCDQFQGCHSFLPMYMSFGLHPFPIYIYIYIYM